MKKKNLIKIIAVTAVSCMAMGVMTACDGSRTPNSSLKLITLDVPTNVKVNFWDLTWDSVENSSSYVVRGKKKTDDNTEAWLFENIETQALEFDLYPYFLPEETYVVEIKAKGDNKTYADSKWTNLEYETEKVTSGLEYYLFDDDTYWVAASSSALTGNLVLPDTYCGKSVTAIMGGGFNGGYDKVSGAVLENRKTTGVRLPLGLKEIKSEAFHSCLKLENIKFPNGLTAIHSKAFYNCKALKEVEIPASVTTIYSKGFGECENLKTIKAADEMDFSMLELHSDAFKGSAWEEEQENDFIFWEEILYRYQGNAAVLKATDIPKTDYFSVGLFQGNETFTSVSFPSGYKEIPTKCFYKCLNLTAIELPNGIEMIGNSAFDGCEKLAEIELPNSVTSIGAGAFEGCGLTSIEISDGLEIIGSWAFRDCPISEITLPNGVNVIGENVFQGTNIKEIIIPSSVTALDVWAFGQDSWALNPYASITLERIYYCGNNGFELILKSESFSSDVITLGKSFPESITVYHYSENEPTKNEDGTYNGNYWRYVDDKPTAWE